MKRPFEVNVSFDKINKYIEAISLKYPVVSLASVVHPECYSAIKVFELEIVRKLTELALRSRRFDFANKPANSKRGYEFYKTRFTRRK